MKDNRSILFYILGADNSTHPYTFERAELENSLVTVFGKVMFALSETCPSAVPKSDTDASKDYDFYDWLLKPLKRESIIGNIPNPGIVIAIKKGVVETDTMATAVKLQVENTQDAIQQDLLNQFLTGGKGHVCSGKVSDRIISSVEVKPKIGPIRIDLKKLFKRR